MLRAWISRLRFVGDVGLAERVDELSGAVERYSRVL